MSILTIIQDASLELGFSAPTTAVGNSNLQVKQLLAHAHRTGKELASDYEWPQLSKEHTFSFANGTASYALPTDFDRFIFCTAWDRTNHWEMIGPMTAEQWQILKSGVTTSSIYYQWRFKGITDTQFYVDPTPDETISAVFEYQSKTWCRPRTWETGITFTANTYCFYNGNYYSTVAGGTAGSTAPTHTSSSASDGAVTWVYVSSVYDRFLADTDVSLIDEELITLGTMWRYKASKNLPGWDVMRADFEARARGKSSNNRGSKPLSLNAGYLARTGYYPNTPDTGFGS